MVTGAEPDKAAYHWTTAEVVKGISASCCWHHIVVQDNKNIFTDVSGDFLLLTSAY